MTLAPSWSRRGSTVRSARAGVRGLTSVIFPVVLLAVAACSDAPTSAPLTSAATAPTRAVTVTEAPATLLECAAAPAASASRRITPAGGLVAVGGHAIAIPRGAVARPTTITMTVPASRYVEVDIKAAGVEHFRFARPVVVTLDYSRCGASADAIAQSFSAWYLDGSSRVFLADMGGVDDRLFRRIFFTTDHLSGYAVAYRAGAEPPSTEQLQ